MNRWSFATTLTISTTLSLVAVRSIATTPRATPTRGPVPDCIAAPAGAIAHLIDGAGGPPPSGTDYAAFGRACPLFTVDFIVDNPEHTNGPVDFMWSPATSVSQAACTSTRLEAVLWGFPLDGSSAVQVTSETEFGKWNWTENHCQLFGTVRIGRLTAAPAQDHPPFPYGHLRLAVGASSDGQTLPVQSDATGI
jgi:hypothetical protein